MATTDKIPHRERRPSMGAPIVDIQGSVGPAGISRPKHKRTLTGFGAGEIKAVEGEFSSYLQLFPASLS
jgi:starch phosphorylase